jgi:hypothetical protein
VNERERDKNAARRLAILRHAEEVSGNVALTCRYYGITRQAFYQWRRRYETGGLDALRDRSRRPQTCPHETPTEIVGKIIYLRQNYHFGPTKIAMYLKRYPTCRSATRVYGASSSGWASTGCPLPSGTSPKTGGGSGMRSSCPATTCRST